MAHEFGRTPDMNPHGGRDHFAELYTNMFIGGGIKPGRIIGKTDETGAKIADMGWKYKEQPMMDHCMSTIYSALGIDYSKKIPDTPSGRAYEYQQTAPLGGPAFIPLAEINEVRRCVRSDAKPFAAEQGLGSRDATSLPVRAGDVDARISAMRIAERREKGDRPLEAKLERSGRTGEEVLERLRVSRVSCARRQRYGRRCSRQGELHPVTAGRPDIWRSSWPTVRLRFRRCTTESSIP